MSAAACTVIKTEIYRQLLPQLQDQNCEKPELLKRGFHDCVENHNVTAKKESYLTENAQYLVTMDSIISCLTRCTRSTELYL